MAETEGDKLRELFSVEDPFRIEHWYEPIKEFTFETHFLHVDSQTCIALSKYAEGLRRLRQCMKFADSLENRIELREETSKHPLCSQEHMALINALEKKLDDAITACGDDGAFVKLSTRSPKDSCLEIEAMRVMIAQALKKDNEEAGGSMDLTEWRCHGVNAFVDASCKVLRVRSGKEAMFLILQSNRIYTDISRLLLVNADDAVMQIAVRRWDSRVVPALEFRSFVYNHEMTSCTQYYKTVYDPYLAEHSQEISNLILKFFNEKIKPRIPFPDYTVDFAVTYDLNDVICVELNNLPPAAGTALFNWNDPKDHDIIEHGPYEFRFNSKFPENSFQDIIEPIRLFIDYLHSSPQLYFTCDCCGICSLSHASDKENYHYHCKECLCSLDICSDCWKAGWGLRHVRQTQSELFPNGHSFLKQISPFALSEDAETPPEGPKSQPNNGLQTDSLCCIV